MKEKMFPTLMLTIFLMSTLALTAKIVYAEAYIPGFDFSTKEVPGTRSIDWSTVSKYYGFAFHKATEGGWLGTPWSDPNFYDRMDGGHNAGLWMGAYHFARPDTFDPNNKANDPFDEANWFLYFTWHPPMAKNYLWYGLPPALDLEDIIDPDTGKIIKTLAELGWSFVSDWALKWLDTVRTAGYTPILYTYSDAASHLDKTTTYNGRKLTDYRLWIANWGVLSPDTGIWPSWLVWQDEENTYVEGIGWGPNEDWMQSGVGGVAIPIDKFNLLAPYIGLTSTILVATVATTIYVKRVKHRKKRSETDL